MNFLEHKEYFKSFNMIGFNGVVILDISVANI